MADTDGKRHKQQQWSFSKKARQRENLQIIQDDEPMERDIRDVVTPLWKLPVLIINLNLLLIN